MLVLGGRAPALRWGQGSLQEIDHVPFVRPLVKLAATATATAEIPGAGRRGAGTSPLRPHCRPDVPRLPARPRVHGGRGARARRRPRRTPRRDAGRARCSTRAVALLRDAERPVIMAGTNLYWAPRRGRAARAAPRRAGIPVFLNGLARGCLPADHPLFFSRARGAALKGADVALVVGVPMDFRLGFGQAFGAETRAGRARRRRARARAPAARRRRALRRPRRARCATLAGAAPARRTARALDRAPARGSRTRSAPPSASSSTTRAPRCTRCASTRSSARCSTATRS